MDGTNHKLKTVKIDVKLINRMIEELRSEKNSTFGYGVAQIKKYKKDYKHYHFSIYKQSDVKRGNTCSGTCLYDKETVFAPLDQPCKEHQRPKMLFRKGMWSAARKVEPEDRKALGILLAGRLFEDKYTLIELPDGVHALDDSDEVIDYLAEVYLDWAKRYYKASQQLKTEEGNAKLRAKQNPGAAADQAGKDTEARISERRKALEEVSSEIRLGGRWDCYQEIRRDDAPSFEARFFIGNWKSEHTAPQNEAELASRFLETVWNTWRITFRGGDLWTDEDLLNKVKHFFGSASQCTELRRMILDKALRYPLMNHLESRGRYPELHAMLLSMTRIEIRTEDGSLAFSAEVEPPGRTVASVVMHTVELMARTQEYAVYELLEHMSGIAAMAREVPNLGHIIPKSELKTNPTLRNTAELAAVIAEKLPQKDARNLLEDKGDYYKMAGKEFRLYLVAWGRAHEDPGENWNAEKNVELLLEAAKAESLEEESRPQHHAEQLYSSESFYAYSYISALPEPRRYALLRAIADDLRKRTDARQRSRQELCLSILSYYLVEDTRIPRSLRDHLFFSTYGRTLYKPQGLMFDRLGLYPCYRNYAKKAFEMACDPEKYGTVVNGRVVSPYFNFLQGALYSDEELSGLSDAKRRMIRCCRLQHDTWHLKNDSAFQSLDDAWLDRALELTRECGDRLPPLPEESGDRNETKDTLCDCFGINMALYALTNLGIRESALLPQMQEFLQKEDSDWLYRAVLLGHYWQMHFAARHGKPVYLIAGATRFVCEYGSRGWLRRGKLLPDALLYGEYAERLTELLSRGDLRGYFVLIRFLSYVGLNPEDMGFSRDPGRDGHRRLFERADFLSYDRIGDYAGYLDQLGVHG